MRKSVFFLFLSFLVNEEIFSSTLALENYENAFSEGLRRRHCGTKAEEAPFLSKDVKNFVTEEINISLNIQEVDEEEIFSGLGDIWTAFKRGDRSVYRKELVRLGLMLDKPDPKALYLLGKVSETLINKIRYHTKALIYSEEDSPLYYLILKAYQECQEEALRRAQERDR